jgi:hypothetical protein
LSVVGIWYVLAGVPLATLLNRPLQLATMVALQIRRATPAAARGHWHNR